MNTKVTNLVLRESEVYLDSTPQSRNQLTYTPQMQVRVVNAKYDALGTRYQQT